MKAFRAFALTLLACGIATSDASAQAGVAVDPGVLTGTIGSNKGSVGPVQCPAGTLLTGVRHVDKGAGGTSVTFGMTSQLDLYCSRVSTGGVSVTLTQTTPVGTPAVSGFAYPNPGTVNEAVCPAGQVIQRMGGHARITTGAFSWVSQVQPACRPVELSLSDWLEIDTSAAETTLPVGVIETNATHTFRDYICANTANTAVSGYHRQAGGEGYDGINIYCGGFLQSRFSAIMTFSDFQWSTIRGGSGWLVDLQRGGVTLSDGGTNEGAGRTPHSGALLNSGQFQTGREIYVIPGSGYTARVSQQPAGIADDTFAPSGTCVTGVTLANRQDASCTLNLDGLADIEVTVLAPEASYTAYGQVKDIIVTAQNLGPGRVTGTDGFKVVATLPLHWSAAGTLPGGCTTTDGRTITCAITSTLAGAASPGAGGGYIEFAIPVRPNTPAATGFHQVSVALDTAAPHADTDPGNDDYDDFNDEGSDLLHLQSTASLTIAKAWVNATLSDAVTVSVTGTPAPAGGAALSAVAGTPNETDTGPTPYGLSPGAGYTISEVFTSGNPLQYTKNLTCTGNTGTGAALTYTANALSGVLTVGDTASDIVCTFTNTRALASIRLQKALTDGRVLAGDQFTLSMTGPDSPVALTTTGSGNTATGTLLHATATAGSAYTLSESAAATTTLSHYVSSYACTNARAGGQTPSGSGAGFTVTPAVGDDLTCVFSNRARRADVSIVKTASASTVQSGQQIQFTLQVSNAGPIAADGAQVRDAAASGLSCSSLSCSAAGDASCPASPSVAGLQSAPGLTIPALPSGGSLSLVLTCTVTASGF